MSADEVLPEKQQPSTFALMMRNRSVFWGGVLLLIMAAIAIIWPLFTGSPTEQNVIYRLKPPSAGFWFGTDFLGRDIFVRVVHGGRISLVVGISVAVIATVIGLFTGLVAGYVRWLDAPVMRIMDGLMAIPAILLAIAMISISGATLATVVIAITIPEIPRVVRLVRAVVLTVRDEPYVEAAICLWHPASGDPDPAYPAEYHRADDRAGYLHLWCGDADRVHPRLPRSRYPAGDSELGQHHVRGADLFPAHPLDHFLSRGRARPTRP